MLANLGVSINTDSRDISLAGAVNAIASDNEVWECELVCEEGDGLCRIQVTISIGDDDDDPLVYCAECDGMKPM